MASGQFPITYATQSPQRIEQTPIRSINVHAPSSGLEYVSAGLGALGAGIEQEQEKRERERKKREAEEKALREFTEVNRGKIALAKYDAETEKGLQGVTNPDQIADYATKRLQSRSEILQGIATMPESMATLNAHQQLTAIESQAKYERYRFGRVQESALGAFNEKLNQDANEGDFATMLDDIDDAFEQGFISADRRENEKEKVKGLVKNWNLTQVKHAARNAYAVRNDKQDAYAIIDIAEQKGLIDIDGNTEAGNWLDGYVSGREREAAAKKREYANKFSSYAIDALNSPMGLQADDVWGSELDKADKELYAEVARLQFEKPVEVDNWDHYKEVMQGLNDLERGTIDQKDFVDRLVQMRYTGLQVVNEAGQAVGKPQYITEKTFRMAVERIKNPLPTDVSNDFAMATLTGSTQFSPSVEFWDWKPFNKESERKRIESANSKTEAWLRSELNAKRRPSAEEINRKAEQFFTKPDLDVKGVYSGLSPMNMPLEGFWGLGETLTDDFGEVWTVTGYNEQGRPLFDKMSNVGDTGTETTQEINIPDNRLSSSNLW